MPLVPGRKVKVPSTILWAAAGGRVEARLVTPGRMQRHNDTDYALIVVAKDKFDRSQNGALDQGVKSIQPHGKQLGKVSRYSSL